MTPEILAIAAGFEMAGTAVDARHMESGHINDTFIIQTQVDDRYLLQRVNHEVFRNPRGLMENVALVTECLKNKLEDSPSAGVGRRVLQLIPHCSGTAYFETDGGEYWRMYRYVEDSHTVGDRPSSVEIYQAANGFGQFIAMLVDLPANQLCETIPNFHHGPLRFEALAQAIREDVANRVRAVQQETDYIRQYEHILAAPQQLLQRGEVPIRVTHNDTKSNNVLLDNATNLALCVIDLDTVMPGLVLYDFGDLVRTTVSTAAEDETDVSKVHVDSSRLAQATRGFLAGCQGVLQSKERESLQLGPCYMALIMATRFLTDYLQGDVYYKTHRPQHNLDRCRAQIALVRGLLENEDVLARLLDARGI